MNKLCVNPAHLEPVPREENLRRAKSAGLMPTKREMCSKGHPFTEQKGRRFCVTCNRIRTRENYRRRFIEARGFRIKSGRPQVFA